MSVLENFKNISRSPSHRATGPKCNFFSPNLQRSPWRKKGGACRPPQRATGACRPPLGRHGPVARWGGDRGPSPVVCRHSLCDLSLKIQKKASPSRHSLCHLNLKIYEKNWSGCRVVTSFWNGGRALLFGHICLGKECDIWETRNRWNITSSHQ